MMAIVRVCVCEGCGCEGCRRVIVGMRATCDGVCVCEVRVSIAC